MVWFRKNQKYAGNMLLIKCKGIFTLQAGQSQSNATAVNSDGGPGEDGSKHDSTKGKLQHSVY